MSQRARGRAAFSGGLLIALASMGASEATARATSSGVPRPTKAVAANASTQVSPPALAAASAPAASSQSGANSFRKLRVLATGSSPFVVGPTEAAEVSGISVDVWREIAQLTEVEYELSYVANVDVAVQSVEAGEADVAVGPITITAERARRIRFTQPYFQSSLAIAAEAGSLGFWARISPFLSGAFLVAICTLLVVLTIVGAFTWLAERKHNSEQFPQRPAPGIGAGIWYALVTMTTVGYGDKSAVTLPGRIVSGVWMVISMVSVSSLTAGIATALTLSQLDRGAISRAEELPGKRVAVLNGSPSADFSRRFGAKLLRVASVEEALNALRAGKVSAVVHDRPILQYQLQGDDSEVKLSEASYESQGYGLALSPQLPLRERLNVALLEVNESGRVQELTETWLGSVDE